MEASLIVDINLLSLYLYINYFDEINKLTSQYNITKDQKYIIQIEKLEKLFIKQNKSKNDNKLYDEMIKIQLNIMRKN